MPPLIVYSREQLLGLAQNGFLSSDTTRLLDSQFKHLKRRKRGRRGGLRVRMKRRGPRLPMPSIVVGNAGSICNKTDELEACVRFLSDYREASLICLSETWLHGKDTDPTVPGFSVVRFDRSKEITKKSKGGGVCMYVNKRWCSSIIVREEHCCQDLELLSVALRPFYLPREFQRVFVTVVYIHPRANTKNAMYKIREVVQSQETTCPDSVRLILGDFNQCQLKKVLPNYKQYVTCKTCGDNTLDRCYGNIPQAYTSRILPSLGRSIHNMVQLVPRYRQRLKTNKPQRKQIKKWTADACQLLNGCFDCTDWDVFFEASSSLAEALDTVTSYIHFCTDMLVPQKEVLIYPNRKPWITDHTGILLKQRQAKLREGDTQAVKDLQKAVSREVTRGRQQYREKVEASLGSNNSRQLWQSVSAMTGYRPAKKNISCDDPQQLAEDLNTFYTRFDQHDCHAEQQDVLEAVRQMPDAPVELGEHEVETCFKKINPRSASGPDNISGKVLKNCCTSLAPVFSRLFQESLDSGVIPRMWKTSTVVPVPKKPNPKGLNDYRPVALTSIPFKCLEKLVLRRLLQQTQSKQDPLQFAYSPNRSTEDAINTLLHSVCKHLEKPKSYARVLFLDFSSAFNTIQPHLMISKLMEISVNPRLIQWVFSFLTDRPQRVKISSTCDIWSSELETNTGAPQGCVLSPALFTVYTSDCRCEDMGVLQVKFSDDTSLSGMIVDGKENSYRDSVDRMVDWCDSNHLCLNVSKTKELIIDFRKNKPPHTPIQIKGEEVEIVSSYKYLGSTLDNKLGWAENTAALVKKGHQRLHFLKKLRSFKVNPAILQMFYTSTVQSVITFNSLCFFGSLGEGDVSKLTKLTRIARDVIGSEVPSLQDLHEKKVLRRIKAILADPSHPLHSELESRRSVRDSGRLLSIRARTNRLSNSFIPSAIRLYNNIRP